MDKNKAKRIEADRQAKRAKECRKKMQREMDAVCVTWQDSIGVGNCEAGTLAVARRCGYRRTSIDDFRSAGWLLGVPAAKLRSVTQSSMAERAIRRAYERETMISI